MINANPVLIRPISEHDLSALLQIAKQVGPGFTSLPNNEAFLRSRIEQSLQTFKNPEVVAQRLFFWVMEDVATKKVVGTCALESMAGNGVPFYCFKVSDIVQSNEAVKRYKKHQVLFLVNDYQNASVYCTLYMDPNFRKKGRGELLSRTRGLFISEFPQLFSDLFIAEMRGISSATGISPFFEALEKTFLDLDFPKADYLRTVEGRQFMADLLPKFPIYVEMLPEAARSVIAKVHPDTEHALRFLKREGFSYRDYVDVLDAGAIVENKRNDIRTVKESIICKIKNIIDNEKIKEDETVSYMVSNRSLNFKTTIGQISFVSANEIELDNQAATLLDVKVQETVRICKFYKKEKSTGETS